MSKGIISDLVTILLTNQRHKRYMREMQQANIRRIPAPMLGTQIRSTEPDHSHSFKNW